MKYIIPFDLQRRFLSLATSKAREFNLLVTQSTPVGSSYMFLKWDGANKKKRLLEGVYHK